MNKQARLVQVLQTVNRARRALGYQALVRLPKGNVSEVDSCPLAKALHGSVDDYCVKYECQTTAQKVARVFRKGYECDFDHYNVKLPVGLRQFYQEFDNEEYPELIAE